MNRLAQVLMYLSFYILNDIRSIIGSTSNYRSWLYITILLPACLYLFSKLCVAYFGNSNLFVLVFMQIN